MTWTEVGQEGERFLRQCDMAHVINSGWVDSLPRHLLRSPPLARVGVSTLVPTTPPNRQRTISAHNTPNLLERKKGWREGGGCRVVKNNGLSGEWPSQVNIHYKRPSSRLCIWAWRCWPCCYIPRHLLPLFQACAHTLLFAWQGECVGGEGCQGEGCVYVCMCVQIQLSTFMTSSVVLSLS